MSSNDRFSRPVEIVATDEPALRNSGWCIFWACLLLIGAAGTHIAAAIPAKLICAGVIVYALQALIAEYRGVVVMQNRIFAPRRFRGFPSFILVGRLERSLVNLQEIASSSKGAFGASVHLRWVTGDVVALIFTNRDKRLHFFDLVRRYRPEVVILRK